MKFVSYGSETELVEAADDETVVVFSEPIQGEGGISPIAAEYLQTTRDLIDGASTVLAFDEIQTDIDRTGALWARENVGVVPDILTSTKGIASGLPLGATFCADWIAGGAASHGSMFSSGSVVYTAASATLDAIAKEDLPGRAAVAGDYLTTEFEAAVEEYDLPVRGVRDDSFMVGVGVEHGANRMLKRLVLPERSLAPPAGRTVARFLPPFVIEEEHADRAADAMTNVLS